MEIRSLHSWQLSRTEAEQVQRQLAAQVSLVAALAEVTRVAGVDVSTDEQSGLARASVVILRYPELTPVEAQIAARPLTMPYIPGLLAFRELPAILDAFSAVANPPQLVMVDGQGIAHPRRLGIAAHLGLLLDLPTVGCAKSILVGEHAALVDDPGARADLVHRGEVVGAALRTRAGVKPIYVSPGHRIDLDTAVHWVLACCRGYRLPRRRPRA